MKKIFNSIALFGLLVAGCTDADHLPETPDNPATGTEEGSGYLALNVLAAGGAADNASTKALDGSYTDGKDVENKVDSIRFYFFDQNFDPALVRKNPNKAALYPTESIKQYDSYFDYKPSQDEVGSGDNENIARTIRVSMMVNLYTTASEKMPKYVVAILNPTKDACVDNPSLTTLAGVVADFHPDTKQGKPFVMSNSVYADGSTKMNYTTLKENALCKKLEDALKPENQTTIYVERVTARVDLTIGEAIPEGTTDPIMPASAYPGTEYNDPEGGYTADAKNVYFTRNFYQKFTYSDSSAEGSDDPVAVDDDDDATPEVPGEPIFVKFIGWTVTSTPTKSYLLKDINPDWKTATLFGTEGEQINGPWNTKDYFRSFWAINPGADKLKPAGDKAAVNAPTDYAFFSYNEVKAANGFDGEDTAEDGEYEGAEKAAKMYIQENAALSAESPAVRANHTSKVIVAAQLVHRDGTPFKIVEYGFKYYEKDDLLNYFAAQLSGHFYTNPSDKAGTKLTVKDLTYKTQAKHKDKFGADETGGYFAYVALSDAAKDKTWYRDEIETPQTEADVNKYIEDLLNGRLLIWEDGMTYYYFPIEHLGRLDADKNPTPAYYGVVRNHIYRANIITLKGLGTPVLDADEKIYPEKPERDGHILAADIKVLKWRVVKQDYEFSW